MFEWDQIELFTFGIQHARNIQIFLGHVESQVQILQRIVLHRGVIRIGSVNTRRLFEIVAEFTFDSLL